MENIREKMEARKKKKIVVAVTIDEELREELLKFKDEQKINQLSPMLNEILWDWLNNQKKREDKKK